MTEMKIIPGKHDCKTDMDMRLYELEKGIWVVYGTCSKCKEIIIDALFQQESPPVQDVDFMVDYSLVAKVRRSHKL
jgi:hypothetical protein